MTSHKSHRHQNYSHGAFKPSDITAKIKITAIIIQGDAINHQLTLVAPPKFVTASTTEMANSTSNPIQKTRMLPLYDFCGFKQLYSLLF